MDDRNFEPQPIKSQTEFDEGMREISSKEQVYSIALFDILGFSKFVEANGNQVILDLYNKLLDLVEKQKSVFGESSNLAGSVVPVPISNDWTSNALIADANGYINVCHFSDTFIIYVNYLLGKQPFWLRDTVHEPYPLLFGEIGTEQYPIVYEQHRIYLSFLQTCMDFFCQATVAGIPLRGCVSTGLAVMDPYKSIYVGSPIVEAARGEPGRNSIGISFGKSFNNHHPVYNNYFIPYFDDIKPEKSNYLSPMVLDWARYWRDNPEFKKYDLHSCINNMNTDQQFSYYYDNAIRFYDFSEKHKDWSSEIKREGIRDILDYYNRTKDWYETAK